MGRPGWVRDGRAGKTVASAVFKSSMSSVSSSTCPQCGKPFDFDHTPSRPFCSRRCQTIDLGRWLDEDVQIPHEGGPGDDAESPVREIRFDDDAP